MVGRLELLFQHLTNDILYGITAKVKALPHRDVTIGTYKDWVELYITSLRRFGTLLKEETRSEGLQEVSSAFSNADHSVLFTSLCETYLSYVRRELDAVLLSSIFATKWNDVHLPLPYAPLKTGPPSPSSCATDEKSHQTASNTSSSTTTSPPSPLSSSSSSSLPSAWWYHSNGYSWKSRWQPTMEMISPEFFTEPLLGGRMLSLYWSGLKSHRRLQASSSLPVERQQEDCGGRPSVGTSMAPPFPSLLVPFSTLWALKAEAFGHATPSRSVATIPVSRATAGPPRSRASSVSPPLSFQERHVRQTVLHTLQFSWELITSPSPFVGWHTSFPRLLLLLPSEELDAICHLPTLRHRLWPQLLMAGATFPQPHSTAASPSPTLSSPHSSLGAPPSPWTIDAVSEDVTCRLAYFSQACAHLEVTPQRAAAPRGEMSHKKDAASHSASEVGASTPSFVTPSCVEDDAATKKVILLAPSHRQALYRQLGAPFLKDRATALDKVLLPDGTCIGSPRKNARREVVQGCKAAAKRLGSREENIRQIFQCR